MLPPEKLEQYEKRIAKIYDDLSIKIIQDIADRITSFDLAKGIVTHNIDLLQQMGYSYDNILRLVAEANNMTFVEVQDIFFDAGLSTLYSDDAIYKRAGMNPVPLNKSPAMLNLIRGTIARTNGMFENLTSTIANNTQTLLYNTLNKAYMEVSSGYKSYSQTIISAIKEIAQQSSIVTYPSGHRDTIEVAVRRAVITSVNQTCGKIQKLRADEMKWDLMVLTAHYNARPSHVEWQGRVVSLSGKKGYLSLHDIGYGTIEGFQGINCRHSWFPYFEGSSLPYTEEELERYKNNTVKYNGEAMKGYEAAQKQRYLERKIRQDKKEIAGLEQALKNKHLSEAQKVDIKTEIGKRSLIYNTDKQKLDSFIEQTNATKDYLRIKISENENHIIKDYKDVMEIANKYNNSDIIGLKVNGFEIKEIGEHIISRTYARNVSFEDVEDCLKNPIKYGKIKEDDTMQIKGLSCTVAINVKTGKLTTVFPKKTKKKG